MVKAKISRATKIVPAQMAMSTAFSNMVSPPKGASLDRRQPAFLQGYAIKGLALPADEQDLVAFEHLGAALVRLHHHVVRPAEAVTDLGTRRMTRCGAADQHTRAPADETVEADRSRFIAGQYPRQRAHEGACYGQRCSGGEHSRKPAVERRAEQPFRNTLDTHAECREK